MKQCKVKAKWAGQNAASVGRGECLGCRCRCEEEEEEEEEAYQALLVFGKMHAASSDVEDGNGSDANDDGNAIEAGAK